MSLRLLIDECILDKILLSKLRAAGHDVITVADVGLLRKPDHTIFEAAIAADRMVMTINCVDFLELASAKKKKNLQHPGILLLYKFNSPPKEMTYVQIIKSIANLEEIGVALTNACHKLNDYNY